MHKILDNVLPQEDFENIKNFILNPQFPWNLTPVVTNDKENLPISASYYFTHEFWSGFNTEPQAQVFAPLLNDAKNKNANVVKIQEVLFEIIGNIPFTTEELAEIQNAFTEGGLYSIYTLEPPTV